MDLLCFPGNPWRIQFKCFFVIQLSFELSIPYLNSLSYVNPNLLNSFRIIPHVLRSNANNTNTNGNHTTNTNNTNNSNTNANNTTNTNNPTIQELAQIISQQVAIVLPTLVTQLNQAANTNPIHNNGNNGERTFIHSDCPKNLKVRYATSVFQKRALTWWNSEKQTRGSDAALALTWTEFKQLMTDEFCPRNEMRKLEAEFWKLKQDIGENLAYTTRFHELSLLVPHLVTTLSRAIEKYIGGLPMQIQDTAFGSKPTTLEDAIRLAATLTDNHVKARTLTRKGAKKVESKSTTDEPSKEATPVNPALANGRACYECGDPNHLRNQCPQHAGNNQRVGRARTLQLTIQDAQQNQDVE
ncbi:hypothetical protein E3N88_28884 [Mikania micrantha]|uniref:CCHC-type domain-containing protein n=1 Tax=Mikania micrantha TaxID=192012 RepID=A0A5N6N0R0_9ASTR|nr:hypothetical protein E3N88_28884 [Mikania micrantha]